jgi:hypothetical protein
VERNKVGRYYQYANSLLCKISSKSFEKDQKRLIAWIAQNQKVSKNKSVKIVFYEPDFDYRKTIKEMVKQDTRFCARGYHKLENLGDVLNYQMPQLVMMNRALIAQSPDQFEPMKKYGQSNFCYCVTYAHDEVFDVEDFKKNYPFAMHSKKPITIDILEEMINEDHQDNDRYSQNSSNDNSFLTASENGYETMDEEELRGGRVLNKTKKSKKLKKISKYLKTLKGRRNRV